MWELNFLLTPARLTFHVCFIGRFIEAHCLFLFFSPFMFTVPGLVGGLISLRITAMGLRMSLEVWFTGGLYKLIWLGRRVTFLRLAAAKLLFLKRGLGLPFLIHLRSSFLGGKLFLLNIDWGLTSLLTLRFIAFHFLIFYIIQLL